VARLRTIDPLRTTPLEAINLLTELAAAVREGDNNKGVGG
jgi:hypothetical protein